jgi:hypothetical protein
MNWQRLKIGLLLATGALSVAGGVLVAYASDGVTEPALAGNPECNTSAVLVASVSYPSQQSQTPVPDSFTDLACLDCHTDQEALTALAKPKEDAETLSEGPG